MTAKIVHLNERHVARCPCGGSEWEIVVDKPGDFNFIKGIQCSDCGGFVEFGMTVVGRTEAGSS